MRNPPAFPRRSQGFTLLEVLVSSFILAIGMLGLAALQGKGLRYNQNAYYASQAALLAYDMADRMRANKGASVSYVDASGASLAGADKKCLSDENAGVALSCSAVDMAANDLYHWHDYVNKSLPGGVGTVTSPAAGAFCAAGYLIIVAWNQRDFEDTSNANTGQSYSLCLENP